MDQKSKNAMIVSVIALCLVLIGVTYAYFSARITGLESASTISLTAGRMGIHYAEGDENVTISNIYPRAEAWATKTFTLTGWNTTNAKMNYYLDLNVTTNTFPTDYLTYDLTLVSGSNGSPIQTRTNVPINGTGKILLGTGYFENANGAVHSYELKIYFKDNGQDQNDGQEAVFNAKIYVEEALGAPQGWSNPESGSLLAAIKNNNSETTEMLTVPGKEISAAGLDVKYYLPNSYLNGGTIKYATTRDNLINDVNTTSGTYSQLYSNLAGKYMKEPVGEFYDYVVSATSSGAYVIDVTVADFVNEYETSFLATEDDYGTSYYYRGIIDNNYVSFAGMCWRIVRITGNGDIKLVLHNYNPTSASNPCASSLDGDTKAFARVGSDTNATKTVFNNTENKITYVGYMYSSTPNSTVYEEQFANDNDSVILTKLKQWYDQVFSASDKAKLADTIWCNDKRFQRDNVPDIYQFYSQDDDEIVTIGQGLFTLFATFERAMDVQTARPSLRCGDSINDNKISKFTASDTTYGNGALNGYKIGLLTVDEVAFAGSTSSAMLSASYLVANTNDNYFTMNPIVYYNDSGYVANNAMVASAGSLGVNPVDLATAIRPAIALSSTVQVTGSGTQASPFVVQ